METSFNFIKDIGRSYIVSSFVPAGLFICLMIFVFHDQIPPSALVAIEKDKLFGVNGWIIVISITLWLAFALYSGVDWTYKLFEGYFLPWPLWGILRDWKIVQLERSLQGYRAYKQLPKVTSGNSQVEKGSRRVLINRALVELSVIGIRSPLNPDDVLPTTLGNILRASEQYPIDRYHIEGITVWPRLHKILPQQIRSELEEKNNQLAFMLNSSLLALLLALMSYLYGLLRFAVRFSEMVKIPVANVATPDWFQQNILDLLACRYLLVGLLFTLVGYLIYKIAIHVAEDYALIVRSGFDLYRMELLRQLNFEIPKRLEDERVTWSKISEFMIAGTLTGLKPRNFEYSLRAELIDPKQHNEKGKKKARRIAGILGSKRTKR